jgi:hypothetical protein
MNRKARSYVPPRPKSSNHRAQTSPTTVKLEEKLDYRPMKLGLNYDYKDNRANSLIRHSWLEDNWKGPRDLGSSPTDTNSDISISVSPIKMLPSRNKPNFPALDTQRSQTNKHLQQFIGQRPSTTNGVFRRDNAPTRLPPHLVCTEPRSQDDIREEIRARKLKKILRRKRF